MADNEKMLAAPKTHWTQEELDRLTAQAQRGDERAMAELRAAMDSPDLQLQFTDIAALARTKRAQATFGADNLIARELLERRVADQRRALEGQQPSPLERLLAEEIATCWAALHLADLDASKARGTLEQAEHYDRRHYRAHKRYLDSLVALARVRRLLSPAVAQVNIAQAGARQLNVAAPEPLPAMGDVPGQVQSASSIDAHTPSA